jgi:hypothetical protein
MDPFDVDRLRRTSLEAVLQRLGAIRDQYDRRKWHAQKGVISVTGSKFFNWNCWRGGAGAIDLLMHLLDCNFKDAVNWLSNGPAMAVGPSSTKTTCPAPRFMPPVRDDSKLPRVVGYLLLCRRLSRQLIESLIESGNLYADSKANAVFLLLGKEKSAVGAELRGITSVRWRGMAAGSRKDLGYFSVSCTNPSRIVLTESAIDAISYLALHPDSLAISTAGANPNPAWLRSLIHQGCPVFCGFDSDQTGNTMANKMIRLYPTIRRLRPPKKDWNDVLKSL